MSITPFERGFFIGCVPSPMAGALAVYLPEMQKLNSDRGRQVMAACSGLLLTGAFPDIGFSWLAWIGIVPLLAAVRNLPWRRGFGLGFLAGMAHFLTLVYWIAYTMRTYGHLPWPVGVSILALLAAYLALFFASFTALVCRLRPQPHSTLFLAPVIWVALEYLQSFFLSGFPWELLGYSQYKELHLIQISDILGVYGVSFLILFTNTAVFFLLLNIAKFDWNGVRITRRFAAAALTLCVSLNGLNWYYGAHRLVQIDKLNADAPSIRVAIVQGNIEQALKWDPAFQGTTIDKYLRLSQSVVDHHPELVVWPETALPFHFRYDVPLTEKVQEGVRRLGAYFLVGSPSFERGHRRVDYYNSAYLIDPQGNVLGKYDKAHLVPFGEYVPLKRWLPFLGKLVEQVGDFSRGDIGDTIEWTYGKLGVLICYEGIFPDISQTMVRNGANLLVNITNDAWYGRSSAPYQHFSMTVFRAIENRRALIRSANTGISGFVDPVGRILGKTALFSDAVEVRQVPLISTVSLYSRLGDAFAVACLAVAGILLCGVVVTHFRRIKILGRR
ncbi:MAG: apolipoprotein N-acyltransferase [Desulfobacterales bacterium]